MFYFFVGLIACMPPKTTKSTIPEIAELQTFKEDVDQMGNQLVKDGWMTSLSIGLIHPGGVEYYNYGVLNKETSRSPSKDSIYEIGSVSKVFTCLLLAEKVQRAEIALDAPLQDWALQDWTLPFGDETRISAQHLCTHSSGLPRLPSGFTPSDFNNPYAEYTVDMLQASLGATKLAAKPGTKVEYSNLGLGLLGYALTQQTKKSYEAALQETIAGPMNMKRTTVDVVPENLALVAQGYGMAGEAVPDWDMPVLIGMGEINSTTEDMLTFLSMQLSPPETVLGKAIQSTQKPQMSRRDGFLGLGWHIGLNDEAEIIWHNGGTGGSRSFVAFDPKRKIGLVVLSTGATPFADSLGVSLYKMLRGTADQLDIPKILSLSPETLQEYAGDYVLSPELVLQLSPNANHLLINIAGQPPFPVYPTSKEMFVSIHAPLKFEFQRNSDGKIDQLFMLQGENRIPGPKKQPETGNTEIENTKTE